MCVDGPASVESRSIWRHALRRIKTALRPDVTVVPAPRTIKAEWDAPIRMRDGTNLRVNVFRPDGDERVPAIMSAHPYGKDHIAAKSRSGRAPSYRYRAFVQPDPITFSRAIRFAANFPPPTRRAPTAFASFTRAARPKRISPLARVRRRRAKPS